ncbi:interleukin-4 receptor subunit alpha isoform X1 [Nycticebus coucang]|uniref:interleukin-4 receptor subunit alpha isoform X1 n=1 Tax=Nycticebus coucang TaxID=9470 RepID=UPI00234D6D01|nr:interleukin-4 receptor subunit alpha isoform X1 [Nycticebus coucang]XP_053412264.1 interleukin-4 receptor subunit alpha isoform X1 [Nycticebus coucang]XP_053412265.1 interleukin-4 receptor subunit alpha isoform X1 [Nycticebus coucang]
MGWLCSGLLFPVSYLILLQVTGSGSMEVLLQPTCFSDYISISTCEWKMASPINCSAELHLSYKLDFGSSEALMCVPKNSEGTGCVCNMLTGEVVGGDTYMLDLWAGQQLLWTGSFKPVEHVKPRAPGNLTVHTNVSDMLLLTWSNPYPFGNFLHSELAYMVNVSSEHNSSDFRIYNVTYMETVLRITASTLKSEVSYRARVRAWAESYNSTWSEWSPSVRWLNSYKEPFEKRLPLGVSISCVVILAISLSCYFSIIKIKKEWWDQIPNPAHSTLKAIVIQDSQVLLWERRSRGQEPAKCPHWKTCLTKLLPCLLEHGMKKEGDSPKAARNGPSQGPEKSAWLPVEVSKTVLWPESICVVGCVELFEAPVENEEEEVEEDKGSFCTSPDSSGDSFQDGRLGIMARMTEDLLLDLLGGEQGGFGQQGLEESCLPPPLESMNAELPNAELKETSSQGKEQPFSLEPNPPASLAQGPACLATTEMPVVIADNPAYRSFSSSLSQSLSSRELDADPQLAECLEEGDSRIPCAPQPSEQPPNLPPELESWEQILRQSVLQHGAATAHTSALSSGYREFMQVVKQGSSQDSQVAGLGPSGEAGYKAFSSLLTSSAMSPETSGPGASSEQGGYKPFQNLIPACPGDPAPAPIPLFTFGLDVEAPDSPQNSLLPSSSPEHLGLEPGPKGEDRQKPLPPLVQATDPLSNDLGSGIVYSALTCHLCGHLKQCHGQEESSRASVVARPCCGCCCGDRSSPPQSPQKAPDPSPGGVPLEASLSLASLAPLGISEESKSSLSFQPAPSSAQGSSQTPKIMNLVSTEPTCMRVS